MSAGRPQFPLARPTIGDAEVEAVVRVLRSGALVQGVEVARLEAAFGTLTGAAEAVAVANGTVALELALRVLGVGPGDEVILPAFSFMATANAVENRGATPVFVDIRRDTFNIDPALVEAAVTPRTRVLMPVHEFGLCCDIDALVAIGARHHLALVEDAACAIGSLARGRPAGSFGLLGTFSLHPRKIVTCGEGGVVVTRDPALGDKLRCLRNHGSAPGSRPASFVEAGTNARLTDIQAALALPQLARLRDSIAVRSELAAHYLAEIRHPGVLLPKVPEGLSPNWQTFHLLLAPDLDRDQAISRLASVGIGSNVGAQCMPAQPYFKNKYGLDPARCYPNAWNAWRQGLAIPMYEALTPADVSIIARAINDLS
jgi:dTDP-4-amino-4,6-dideoxygalactose transaminase